MVRVYLTKFAGLSLELWTLISPPNHEGLEASWQFFQLLYPQLGTELSDLFTDRETAIERQRLREGELIETTSSRCEMK